MKLIFTEPAKQDYTALPEKIKKLAIKQLNFLRDNIRHPSIKAKKYNESEDLWQGRINKAYRFYFKIVASTYIILAFTEHPK